jgi:NADH-quinone oxidoreductase subunit N
MTIMDFTALLPLIVITATALLLMLVIAFYRSHALTAFLTIAGIALSFYTLQAAYGIAPHRATDLLTIDHYSIFYTGLILAASFAVALLSYGYLKKHTGHHEEFYLLLLMALLGSAVVIMSSHFASFFLGLEILSVSLYALVAYVKTSDRGTEAGIKYLVLAAVSASFLLFGIALIYAQLGTLSFSGIAASKNGNGNLFYVIGTILIIVGVGFKLALVPFHMWTPDVYEGAPAPVTAFIATVSKGALFAFLLRYFSLAEVTSGGALFITFSLIAVASMFFGNILALMQNNVKRILAYSSISHLGYLIVAFLAGRVYALIAVTLYLIAYFITTLGAFGIVSVLSGSEGDADDLARYRGMAWKRPFLSAVFTAMLLSLAGIPLTAGFIAKFYIMGAGVGSGLWMLVSVLVATSAIGLFYYLRVIITLYKRPSEEESHAMTGRTTVAGGAVLAALAALLLWLGIYPSVFIEMIQAVIGSTFI